MAFHFNVASAEVLQASFCGMDITPCKLPPTPGCPAPPPPATVVPPTPPPLFGPTSSSFFTPGAVSGRQKKIPKKPEGQPLEDEFPNLTIHVTSAPSNTSAFPPPPSFSSGLSAPTFHAGAKEGNPRASPRRSRKAPEKHQHHAQPHASIDPYPAPKPPIFSATPPRPPPKPATISFTEPELKRLVNSVSAAARAATRAEFFALAAEKSAASASVAFSSMKPPSLSSSFANFSFGTNNEVPVTFHFGSPPPPPNKPNRGPDPSSYWNPHPPPPAATSATDNFSAPKFPSNTSATTTGSFASFASIPTPAPSFAPPKPGVAPPNFNFPPPPAETKQTAPNMGMPSNAGIPPNVPGPAFGFPGASPPPPPRPSNSQYTFVPAPPPRRDSCTSSSSSSAAAAATAAAAAASSSSSSSSFDFSAFSASVPHSKPPIHPTFTPNPTAHSTNTPNPTNPTSSAETTHGASFESPLPSPRTGMESPNRRVYRASRRSEAGTGRGVADDKENDKPPRGTKPAGGSAARKKPSPRNAKPAKPSPSPRHTPEQSEQEDEPPVFRRQSSAYSSCSSSTTNPSSTDPNGLETWSVKQLVRELTKFGVATEECLEKSELILKVRQCYMQTFEQRKAAQSKQKAAETAEKVAKDAERAKEKVVLEVAAWAKKKNILQMLNDVSGKKPNEAGYLRNTDPLETVVKAYKKALLLIHPDKHMGDEIGHIRATERFKYVHEAMESHKASMEKKQYFYSAQYGFKAGSGGVPRSRASAGSSQFW